MVSEGKSSAFQSTHPVRGATSTRLCPRWILLFQSTHPVRGATIPPHGLGAGDDISIHAPREGCDRLRPPARGGLAISIHAPREGCDGRIDGETMGAFLFQSTHPVRGATGDGLEVRLLGGISIHAPREGCDVIMSDLEIDDKPFQSTHPVRGATQMAKLLLNSLTDFNPRTP